MRAAAAVSIVLVSAASWLGADEPVFSGPQPGEKLPPFRAVYALDQQAGEPFDLVSQAKGSPVLIVFVHELTRPSIGLTRLLGAYAASRHEAGLHSGIIFLSDDVSETEARIKRARHALPQNVPIGVSLDGREGPGSYGLNRKVTLTVLVAKEGRVTANFALVQPSIAVDAPRIGGAIAEVLGDARHPTLAEMGADPREQMAAAVSDDRFRALLAPVIQKTASPDQVRAAAKHVEALAQRNAEFRARVGSVAQRIVGAGRLPNYGTETAQGFLEKWAKEFAGPAEESADKADKAPDQDAAQPTR